MPVAEELERKPGAAGAGFMTAETRFTGRYSRSVFETLHFAYRSRLAIMAGLVVVGFVGRVLLLSNANIIGHWVDTFCRAPLPCRPVPTIFRDFQSSDFVALLAVVTFAGFSLTALFRILFSRISAQAVSHIYDEVTSRASRLPIRFYDTTPVGAVVTRFSSDYGNIFRLFGGPLAEFGVIIFDLLGMFCLVTFASPWYLPIFILIGVLNWMVYRLNVERLRTERRELSASRAPSIAHFSETAQGAGTIRIFSRQNTFMRRFQKLNGQFLRRRLSTFGAIFRFSYQMSLLSALLLLLTGLLGWRLAAMGWLSIGSIGVAFTFIALSAGSMQMFFEWMSQFEEAMTGVERLDNYLRRDLEPGARLPVSATFPTGHPRADARTASTLAGGSFGKAPNAAVTVENLWFRYHSNGPWVLKDVSFEVRPGERLGIVGRTGSGKSSLIQALFHLYPIERGQILIDGQAPLLQASRAPQQGEVDLERFRRAIALISQEPTLFRGTLRENLSLRDSFEDAVLLEAVRRVGLGSWLAGKSLGLQTPIEERGRNLSLGERQLICMARCLLQNAPVVIMDEATSAVDPQSEELLVRATEEFFSGRTQLIIAHRLSTLQSCDRILCLQDGVVQYIGLASEVLQRVHFEAEHA